MENQERTDGKDIIKQWQELVKPIQKVASVKIRQAKGLDDLAKAIDRLPTGDVFQRGIDALRVQTESWVATEKKARSL